MRVDHIGYVTSDLKKSIKTFKELLDLKPITKIIKEPAHKVKLIFFELNKSGYPAIELITPISRKSKVSNFLLKNGNGFHHLAYEVEDIHSKIIELKKKILLFYPKLYLVLAIITPQLFGFFLLMDN